MLAINVRLHSMGTENLKVIMWHIQIVQVDYDCPVLKDLLKRTFNPADIGLSIPYTIFVQPHKQNT